MADTHEAGGGSTIDRRAILKRAAAAGAVAWTAPMIIDSFASPAAAATVAPGCYGVRFANGSATCTQSAPTGATCAPASYPGSTFPGIVTGSNCNNNVNPTFTIAANISCVFVAGGAEQTLTGTQTCRIGSGAGTKTMTFTRSSTSANWSSSFKMRVVCGGASCT